MKNNYIKIEFSSLSENEGIARQFVAAYAALMDPTLEELAEIRTAVSEAVSNSIIHGYMGRENGIIILEIIKDDENKIYITITDEGKGISNVEEAMKPLYTTGNPDERAGMGFTVMESFMDNVKVNSKEGFGTKVTMTKKLGEKCGKEL